MNLDNLFDHLPYMAYAFRTLSTEERLKLEHSLRVLQRAQRLNSVYFLGKLEGTDADYILAFGCTGRDIFKSRRLFYSQNLCDWFLLLEPKHWSDDWDRIRSPFRGDPAFNLQVDLGPEFTLDEDQVPIEGERRRFIVKEQDRLWFAVTKVLQEAAIVPRGVLYHSTEGDCVINPFFGGMNPDESIRMVNYQHFRKPINDVRENLLKREDCSYFVDVFDSAADGAIPKEKNFVVTRDRERDVFVLKSLYWPGMNNFHRVNSSVFGFFYFGDGNKNWDLLFML
ncbi:radial spoke head protein 9 homolog [Ochlerotatus camptorhynchus]|uniref:radial spoke head protein 9 homolog n=1 Tax=Ochlerotatus camptorhynchus TaxID=644619 RepID=UPI0031DAB389